MATPTFKPCEREPELWFSTDPVDQLEAAQACSFCPLVAACEARGEGEVFGVWGGRVRGYTRERRQPKPKPCGYAECGKEFVTATAAAKYCTPQCRDLAQVARQRAAAAARVWCALESCRNGFTPVNRGQRFCSVACGRKNKRATAKEKARKIRENEHLRELVGATN